MRYIVVIGAEAWRANVSLAKWGVVRSMLTSDQWLDLLTGRECVLSADQLEQVTAHVPLVVLGEICEP